MCASLLAKRTLAGDASVVAASPGDANGAFVVGTYTLDAAQDRRRGALHFFWATIHEAPGLQARPPHPSLRTQV